MFKQQNVVCRALLATVLLVTAVPTFAESMLYKNPKAPVAQRVQDLLSRMTLEEKTAQLRSAWIGKAGLFDANGNFSPDKAAKTVPVGIGQIARPSDTMGTPRYRSTKFRDAEDTINLVNGIQRYLVKQTRLGIPALFHEELAHGLMAKNATHFPIPTGLASTWDPTLIEQVFTVAARQARLRGATVALTPVIDLARDPRYGRVEEFFSEDAYLVSQMGIAAVQGLQGRTRPIANDRVFATLKHFVHATPQGGLNLAPADMGERMLREAYLVPFAQVIKKTDPAIVMPSYNEVNGVPSHASVELLQNIGREQLGFKGSYFSDYGGVTNLVSQHHIAANNDDAAVLAFNAGVEAELPDGQAYAQLPELVRAGRISEAKIDAAVKRVLTLKFEAGLFEHPYVDAKRMKNGTDTPADIQLARTTAEKALILLKNDGVLPLDARARFKLAIIGPNASEPLLGGYSAVNAKSVSILDGLKAAVGPNIAIEHADGVWIVPPDPTHEHPVGAVMQPVGSADNATRIAEAVQVAKRSDVVLLVVGDVPEITREAVQESAPGDRSTLGLYGDQDALVEAMIATGKPIVALLINGRALTVNRLAEKASALLAGWYLGQEGGSAFANVLFGNVNPGGKLTVSLPRSVGELPVYYNRHPSADLNNYVEGKRRPLFPFGYGLSYTSFDLSAPRLARQQISVGEHVAVEVDVTNTGQRIGDEVVQLYIRDDVSSVPRPVLELKAFERVTLKPGEKRTVHFDLSPDALAFWDINMQWKVEPGTFTISAGNSSDALKTTRLTVIAP